MGSLDLSPAAGQLVLVAPVTGAAPEVLWVSSDFSVTTAGLDQLAGAGVGGPSGAVEVELGSADATTLWAPDLPWVLRRTIDGWLALDGSVAAGGWQFVGPELALAAVMGSAAPEAWMRHLAKAGVDPAPVFARLVAAGLVRTEGSDSQGAVEATRARGHSAVAYSRAVAAVADADQSALFVVGIYGDNSPLVPASLGSLLAYLRRHLPAGSQDPPVHVAPVSYVPLRQAKRWARRLPQRALVLLSDYVWSVEENTALARVIRSEAPTAVIARGGPQFPARAGDQQAFFALAGDSFDFAINGEGEATLLAAVEALVATNGSPTDLRAAAVELVRLPGVVVAVPTGLERGPAPERLADLAELGSAYLSGAIDAVGLRLATATVETNRGCPYGCTFCDWGSATLSRIRTRPLDAVLADLTYLAESGVEELLIADANFGLLPRDVEIAQHIADLRARTGFPQSVVLNYSKNVHRSLLAIFDIFDNSDIVIPRTLAMQTTSPDVLAAVNRSNIKVEAYDALAARLGPTGPIRTEFIAGLPGSTVESALRDVQFCFDRNLVGTWYRASLLVNSPMNAPEYRAQYRIEVDDAGLVAATSTFSAADLARIMQMVTGYRVTEVLGLARYLLRVLAEEAGCDESTLLAGVATELSADPARWPTLAALWQLMAEAPRAQWPYAAALEELIDLSCQRFGSTRSTAVEAALVAQSFVLPTRGAVVPNEVELPHDIVGWWRDRCGAPHGDDQRLVRRPLGSYGPGKLAIRPRQRVSGSRVGDAIGYQLEFDSELAKSFPLAILPPSARSGL